MARLPSDMLVICTVDDPTPVAFMNVYEEGDLWIKTQGCEACNPEDRKKCCGRCPMFNEDKGCYWHLKKVGSSKPYYCVIYPTPNSVSSFCHLEYTCVRGTHKGKVRHIRDPQAEILG